MAPELDDGTVALRLGLAFALGSALGLERELRGHAAGLVVLTVLRPVERFAVRMRERFRVARDGAEDGQG